MDHHDPDHIMQFFAFAHLPPHLQERSRPFAELAARVHGAQPGDGVGDGFAALAHLVRETTLPNPETTVALGKINDARVAYLDVKLRGLSLRLLLEGKDAAVRAHLAK